MESTVWSSRDSRLPEVTRHLKTHTHTHTHGHTHTDTDKHIHRHTHRLLLHVRV